MVNTKEVDYALNKTKAASKKIQASLRTSDVEVDMKHGTLVFTLSAAAYEVFRDAIFKYFSCSTERSFTCHDKKSKPQNGETHIVEHSLSVSNKNVKGQLYRINLIFNTTSRADVNGRHMSEFIDTDLNKILEKVCTNVDLHKLNKTIHDTCAEYLEKEMSTKAKVKVEVGESSETVRSGFKMITSGGCEDNECIDCKVCKKRCMHKAVQCDRCLMWLHYACLNLSKLEIEKYEKDDSSVYVCQECLHKRKTGSNVTQTISSIEKDSNVVTVSVSEGTVARETKTLCKDVEIVSTQSACIRKEKVVDKDTSHKILELVPIQRASDMNRGTSVADEILSDERVTHCIVCSIEVERNEGDTCDTCMNICHLNCLTIKSDNERLSICITCQGVETQAKLANGGKDDNIARTDLVSGENSKPPKKSSEKQQRKGEITTTAISDGVTDVTVKMKDLRTKETKLRKWEEELKLKEKALQEKDKGQTHTDSYIAKIEARNQELEHTVRILRRRICMMEESQEQHSEPGLNSGVAQHPSKEKRNSVHLLEKLHDKVTNFILDSMDRQLDGLSVDMNNGVYNRKETVLQDIHVRGDISHAGNRNSNGPHDTGRVNEVRTPNISDSIQCNPHNIVTSEKPVSISYAQPPQYNQNRETEQHSVYLSAQNSTQTGVNDRGPIIRPRNMSGYTSRLDHTSHITGQPLYYSPVPQQSHTSHNDNQRHHHFLYQGMTTNQRR